MLGFGRNFEERCPGSLPKSGKLFEWNTFQLFEKKILEFLKKCFFATSQNFAPATESFQFIFFMMS